MLYLVEARSLTMARYMQLLVSLVVVVSALPAEDPVVMKLDPVRHQYLRDADGNPYLVDLWVKVSDLRESARYSPDTQNEQHLFTRDNPSISQPIVLDDESGLLESNFNASRRTVVLIHGWMNNATSDVFTVLVPAFLEAEDVNVFVIDWSAGASTTNYTVAVINTSTSGVSVAKFLNWLCSVSNASTDSFHIAGHSLGGQQAGIVGRNLDSKAAYITGLDPAGPGWLTNDDCFHRDDGTYTEVIHTDPGYLGFLTPLADVDFYPNGGDEYMPGCAAATCNHARSYYYFAESVTSGGFTGTGCDSYLSAMNATCALNTTLEMGGIDPKTGETGVFYMVTNAAPPFSMG